MLIDYLLLDRGRIMDNNTIESFIRKQKVAFICSIDEEGFPNVKAMLKPRKMEGIQSFYFSLCLCISVLYLYMEVKVSST